LAYDDAKAKARRDGELAGIGSQWERMAAQKEKMLGQYFDLLEKAYEKATEIFAQELTRDNYSMAHAIQIVKLMGESIKLATELEKVYKEAAGNAWTEEDARNLADAMEELRADEAAEFFEEETRRKKEEEEKGSEGAGDAST
jgi:hypothetical protein